LIDKYDIIAASGHNLLVGGGVKIGGTMLTKEKEGKNNKPHQDNRIGTRKMPAPEEVVRSIEKNFEENVKPALDEWSKDVRIIRYR